MTKNAEMVVFVKPRGWYGENVQFFGWERWLRTRRRDWYLCLVVVAAVVFEIAQIPLIPQTFVVVAIAAYGSEICTSKGRRNSKVCVLRFGFLRRQGGAARPLQDFRAVI